MCFRNITKLAISLLAVVMLIGCMNRPSIAELPTPENPELEGKPAPSPTITLPPEKPALPEPSSPPSAPPEITIREPSLLTILSISEGEVLVRTDSSTDLWEPAEFGYTLEVGDTIRAGNDSNAVITFFDGSTIELESNTEVKVSELGITDTGSTTIRLEQEIGRTISRVNKLLDSASIYEIETPAAMAVVRGSRLYLDVTHDGTTSAGNAEGEIYVVAQGITIKIPVHMSVLIVPGHPPSHPRWGLWPEDVYGAQIKQLVGGNTDSPKIPNTDPLDPPDNGIKISGREYGQNHARMARGGSLGNYHKPGREHKGYSGYNQ